MDDATIFGVPFEPLTLEDWLESLPDGAMLKLVKIEDTEPLLEHHSEDGEVLDLYFL